VKVCHAAKPKPTATPEPTATDTPANTPAPVTITGFDIYTEGTTSGGCQGSGASAFVFPASIPAIFYEVHTLNWIGPHEVKTVIVAPNGSVYGTLGPDTFSDIGSYCGLVPIARNGIANQAGTWSIVFYLDGVQAGSTTFTLETAAATSPPTTTPPTTTPSKPAQLIWSPPTYVNDGRSLDSTTAILGAAQVNANGSDTSLPSQGDVSAGNNFSFTTNQFSINSSPADNQYTITMFQDDKYISGKESAD